MVLAAFQNGQGLQAAVSCESEFPSDVRGHAGTRAEQDRLDFSPPSCWQYGCALLLSPFETRLAKVGTDRCAGTSGWICLPVDIQQQSRRGIICILVRSRETALTRTQ